MTIKITPNILRALIEVNADVEGLTDITLQTADNCQPKGRRQDCDLLSCGRHEWVDQTQIGEDSFVGTAIWVVDGVMIIGDYSI